MDDPKFKVKQAELMKKLQEQRTYLVTAFSAWNEAIEGANSRVLVTDPRCTRLKYISHLPLAWEGILP